MLWRLTQIKHHCRNHENSGATAGSLRPRHKNNVKRTSFKVKTAD